MRFIVLVMALALATFPALAGTVHFAEGQGGWESTQCQRPLPPAVAPHDSEAAANDLNVQITQHNRYADAAQKYMACISEEAQNDAQASGQAVSHAAALIIQRTQADVAASAARLKKPQ